MRSPLSAPKHFRYAEVLFQPNIQPRHLVPEHPQAFGRQCRVVKREYVPGGCCDGVSSIGDEGQGGYSTDNIVLTVGAKTLPLRAEPTMQGLPVNVDTWKLFFKQYEGQQPYVPENAAGDEVDHSSGIKLEGSPVISSVELVLFSRNGQTRGHPVQPVLRTTSAEAPEAVNAAVATIRTKRCGKGGNHSGCLCSSLSMLLYAWRDPKLRRSRTSQLLMSPARWSSH